MQTATRRPIGLVAIVFVTGIFALIGLIISVPIMFIFGALDIPSWIIFMFVVYVVDSLFEAIVCYGL